MREVADRVYRLGAEFVNWYVIDDSAGVTVIDAGNPNQFRQLPDVLGRIGRTMGDVEAIVLTHAHGDHLGSAAQIRQDSGADVFVHEGDEDLARGKAHREYERHYLRDLGHWFAWKSLLFFLRGGATKAPPLSEVTTFGGGVTLDVPGRPTVVATPGHTAGSSCVVLDDRDAVFTGDALVTLSIVSGAVGPMVMPGSFNADSAMALESLDRLRPVTSETLLPGHGEPWTGSLSLAVDQAVAHGAH